MIFRAALKLGILYFVSFKVWMNKMLSENYSEIALHWLGNCNFYSAQGWVATKVTQINVSLQFQPETLIMNGRLRYWSSQHRPLFLMKI